MESLLIEAFSDGSSDLWSIGQEPSHTDHVNFVIDWEPSFEGKRVDNGETSFSEDSFIVLAGSQRVVFQPEVSLDRLIVLRDILIIENKLLENHNRRLIGHVEEQS